MERDPDKRMLRGERANARFMPVRDPAGSGCPVSELMHRSGRGVRAKARFEYVSKPAEYDVLNSAAADFEVEEKVV